MSDIRINLRISKEARDKYQAYCENHGTTVSDDLRRYIISKIKEYEKELKAAK